MRNGDFLVSGGPLILMTIACKGPTPATDDPITYRELRVVDSIGVEIGDSNLLLGKVAGAFFLPDGNILVADGAYQDLRLFPPNGFCISRVKNLGNGPLEYNHIGGITPFGEGFVLYEYYLRRFVYYRADLAPVRSVTLPGNSVIDQLSILPDSSALGWAGNLTADQNGDLTLSMDLSRWSIDTGEITTTFSSLQQTSTNPEDLYELYAGQPAVTAGSDGHIYVALSGVNNRVLVLAQDGAPLDTLQNPREPGFRDSLEVEEELLWRRYRDNMGGAWRPDPRELGVIGIQVQDSLGRVWVHHSSYFHPEFDVYRSDGTLEFTSAVSGLPGDELMIFRITDRGILAWNPFASSWPRVYILELQ